MTTLERISSSSDTEKPNPAPSTLDKTLEADSPSLAPEQHIPLPEVSPSGKVVTRLGRLGLGRILPKRLRERSADYGGDQTSETNEVILRQGEWVKEAPSFLEQCDDQTRTNRITYNSDITHALPSAMTGQFYEQQSLTEHESLVGLRNFLEQASEEDNKFKDIATSMLETLTFIGKKEYDEAVRGIAEDWRKRLNENPQTQLCILLTGMKEEGVVKSGEYLFDNVLQHFTSSELKQFRGRLVGSPDDLTASPEDVSVILLDDWTISGKQLMEAGHELAVNYPEYTDRLEIQLIAATEKTIKDGLSVLISDNSRPGELEHEYQTVPISAYYRAHDDPLHAPDSGAHITGAHCSVDYDFNTSIQTIAAFSNDKVMPPATNIIRPYRQKGYEPTRIKKLLGRTWKRKQKSRIK